MKHSQFATIGTFVVLLLTTAAIAADTSEERWGKAIAAFEQQDKQSAPAVEGIVFVGSSSVRLWDLKKGLPELPSINRGFGGSQMADSAYFADRIVIPYRPRVVVVYAGGNDIAAGKSPEQVAQDFEALVQKVHAALPHTKIFFVSLFPSVARQKIDDQMKQANQLIEAFTKTDPRLGYIDTRTRMTAADGGPRPELLRADNLHMNDAGYAIWNEIIGPIVSAAYAQAAAKK